MIRDDDTKQAIHRNNRNNEFMHRNMAADKKIMAEIHLDQPAISKLEHYESSPFLY